jgi:hypothetical protein
MNARCLTGVAMAVVAGVLGGCGKPENSAYTMSASTPAATTSAPLPAAPDWAAGVLGRPVSSFAKGSTVCRGAIDVTTKHVGKSPGDAIEGWAWDTGAKAPPDRLLLADASAKVIGVGQITRTRPDVPKAVPEVKSPQVGWTVVTRSTKGVGSVLGLSRAGALCTIGPAQLS